MRAGWLFKIAGVAVALPFACWNAEAAVRYCAPRLVVAGTVGSTEDAARRTALAAWRTAVAPRGEAWVSWRLAIGRAVTCVPAAEGGFRCEAAAAPCAIAQNPRRPPAGVTVVPER